jgi:hypothetical protein
MDMTKYQVGSRVMVRLFDGRELAAHIKRIDETVARRKVHVRILFMALKLNAEQIIEVLE